MTAYYNENDPNAAAWLRELIREGLIAKGEVDERDIRDIRPADLAGFVQCHFFAGIGGWSYALRLAGWPDDKPVWTGSCPCQPFSAAGKGNGFADERHLWPYWFHLIGECKPGVIFGEQVESAINHGWLDLVQTDLEAKGYAVGAVGLPACSVGAPHIRNRLWWVADAEHPIRGPLGEHRENECDGQNAGRAQAHGELGARSEVCELADALPTGRAERWSSSGVGSATRGSGSCELGDADDARSQGGQQRFDKQLDSPRRETTERSSGLSGFWDAADWLPCRDGKARPVEPGTFPLAHGIPNRVGRLRGYGNAIVPQVAAEFIIATGR